VGLDVRGEGRVEQCVLAVEVGVDQCFVASGGGRDPLDPAAGDAVLGELVARGVEEPLLGPCCVAGPFGSAIARHRADSIYLTGY